MVGGLVVSRHEPYHQSPAVVCSDWQPFYREKGDEEEKYQSFKTEDSGGQILKSNFSSKLPTLPKLELL